jgi:hypothetical protein
MSCVYIYIYIYICRKNVFRKILKFSHEWQDVQNERKIREAVVSLTGCSSARVVQDGVVHGPDGHRQCPGKQPSAAIGRSAYCEC